MGGDAGGIKARERKGEEGYLELAVGKSVGRSVILWNSRFVFALGIAFWDDLGLRVMLLVAARGVMADR